MISVPMIDNLEQYMKLAKETINNQQEYITGPVSIQVHHSFVDGFHVGKLVEKLQSHLNEF
ncbi:chloramphenicol O-acetyltransferase [Fontibacillus solani]|uniref:Chloramphenicol acetyltransferase n=1 Tax=Fontibacillus solani TaxID=1572857 RepID=A0A7W3SRT4_9BACL|nr:CatA-like O-acetyltransferase [Fontibacillus solani]MBA9084899.1 chloramphenicol O-acetyltransferase [Fontibacillus solani]